MNKLKVLFVHNGRNWGGAAQSLFNTVKALWSSGLIIPTIACPNDNETIPKFKESGANVIPLQNLPRFTHSTTNSYSPNSPEFIQERDYADKFADTWKSILKQHSFDIVHLNSMVLCDLIIPSKEMGCKVIQVMRETAATGDNLDLLRERFNKADALVHISEYDRISIDAKTPIIKVIPNWCTSVDFAKRQENRDKTRKQLLDDKNAVTIIFTGGISPIKGGATILDSLKYVSSNKPIKFLFCGYSFPSLPNTLSRKAKKLIKSLFALFVVNKFTYAQRIRKGMTRAYPNISIYQLGFRNDIYKLMCASDICVVPYSTPHQARPIFEAGFAGIPCIVSDFPCLHEDGANNNVIFASPNNPKDWGEKISYLVENDSLRTQMGQANFANSKKRHSPSNANKYIDLYNEILSN